MTLHTRLPEGIESKATNAAAGVSQIIGDRFGVQDFAGNFGVLSEAAGGISNLRQLVLSIAFQEGPLRAGAESNAALPSAWRKAALGDIATTITKGTTPTTVGFQFQNSGIRFVKVENVKRGHIQLGTITDFVSEAAHRALSRSQLEEGDVLFSIAGTIGETCVVRRDDLPANTNQALAIIRGTAAALNPDFLRRQLDSFVSRALKQRARGGAMNNVSLGDLRVLEVVIPPLAEQKRIVARVDQLMALIDELEAKQTRKREVGARFTKASLEALTSAEGSDEFDAAWKRVVENWETVLADAEGLQRTRQTIVDLVVALPGNAEVTRMVTVREIVTDTRYGTARKCDRDATLTPVLRIPNVVRGTLELDDLKYAAFPKAELAELRLSQGDVLVVRSNGSRDLVGRTCVVDERAAGFAFAGYLIRVRLHANQIRPEWFQLALQSSAVRKAIEGPARTTSGVHNVNTRELLDLSIPLPPIGIQSDMLRKAARLLKLCDELEAKLRRAEDRATKLVEAVVQEMVG